MTRPTVVRERRERVCRRVRAFDKDVASVRPTTMGVLLGAAFGIAVLGCGSIKPALPNPMTEPVIDQPGSHIVRYRDVALEAVVETTFADANLGEAWLVLNVGLSGATGEATQVDRTSVSVRTPSGRTVPLPSYKEFNKAYGELASTIRRAQLASQPLEFLRGGRRLCSIDFMPVPGSGTAAKTAVNVTNNDLCVGMLYFPIRGGVQPGRWKLLIELEESEAVVPFALEAE